MNTPNTPERKSSDKILIRAAVATLILFAASTPVAVTMLPGLPVLESVWVAFALSAIAVLFVLLVAGIVSETIKWTRIASESATRAIRGEREARENPAIQAA